MEVLNKFLPQAEKLLSPKGAFYLLLIEENIREIQNIDYYFNVQFLVKRDCPGENQMVLRLTHKKVK